MIKDYKGEMPKNVTTPEKAKAKKPFYKDWKFWVLTGLMTLFGACSIYGLVLGSQYVKAIERASHIIADAQFSDNASFASKKGMFFASTNDYKMCRVDLGTLTYGYSTASGHERFFTTGLSSYIVRPNANSVVGKLVCEIYETDSSNNVYNHRADKTIGVATGGDVNIYDTSAGSDPLVFKNSLAGVYLYFLAYSDASVPSVYDEGYNDGYAEGSADGYEDGYQEGFDDGADSQANEQTIKVLLAPDFTGDRIQYTYTLDGAEVGTGYLSNTNQHYQNQVQFSRPAGGQHKAVLNLYSDNDEPIKIAYDTFTGALGETRYLWYMKSNAYDWSASQWYVPTYWAEARFLVTGYGTYDQGFTEDYFFNLDPQYNDRAKVGAYSEGYDAGYNDAVESGDAYDAGYEQGYDDGERQGETDGFNRGVAVGSSGSQSLALMFKAAFQLPFDQLYRFLNFNLLGINFLSLFTALISVSIGIMVIKKVL